MKIFKTIIVVILLVGAVFTAYGLIAAKGNFQAIIFAFSQDDDFVLVEKNGADLINEVVITGSTHNIIINRNSTEDYDLTYYDAEYDYFEFSILDQKLTLKNIYQHGFFRWGFKSEQVSTITINLPLSFTGKIKAETGTGRIAIEDFDSLTTLQLSSSTGDVNAKQIDATGKIDLNTSTGRVKIENSSGLEIEATTSTGDVIIDTATVTKLVARTSTGSVDLKNLTADDIRGTSSTGSVKMNVQGIEDDYRVEVSVSTGDITFQGVKISSQTLNSTKLKSIYASTSTGDIDIVIG